MARADGVRERDDAAERLRGAPGGGHGGPHRRHARPWSAGPRASPSWRTRAGRRGRPARHAARRPPRRSLASSRTRCCPTRPPCPLGRRVLLVWRILTTRSSRTVHDRPADRRDQKESGMPKALREPEAPPRRRRRPALPATERPERCPTGWPGAPRRSRSWCRCSASSCRSSATAAAGPGTTAPRSCSGTSASSLIVAPFAALLLVDGRSAHQRLGASLALTLIVYASWLLSNPVMSTRFDENLHVTTLVDLIEHAEFFQLNSMLPVSPHFPGLELATAGVHWLTGLPLFACQVLVVATARVTFVTALFLLASRIGRSTASRRLRGPGLRGEHAVLLLQRPVLLPDRRDRDGDGGVLPARPGPSTARSSGPGRCW